MERCNVFHWNISRLVKFILAVVAAATALTAAVFCVGGVCVLDLGDSLLELSPGYY